MKPRASFLSKFLAAAVIASPAAAFAGGSFGPAPFSNGSPLVSGTDGIYQAVATAKNTTGIITWTISSGVQTANETDNDWFFYVDGETLTGTTQANVSSGKVAGILESGITTTLPTEDNGSTSLPLVFIVPGNGGSGSFSAKINLNSPTASIEGSGRLTGTPERTDQIIFIPNLSGNFSISGVVPIFTESVTIPGSSIPEVNFKLRGSRLNTSVPRTTTTTTTN